MDIIGACIIIATVVSCSYVGTAFGKLQYELVTCGSVIKLLNTRYSVRVHSHDVKYGSGSGQQSVTGTGEADDSGSHWAIKGPIDRQCSRGEPIKCGEMVRFEHINTGCLLHSHLFPAPLSQNQEVSCFGKSGEGDTGDHWVVLCDTDFWRRDSEVQLKHKDTGRYLGVTSNKFGRPISGQQEVCAIDYANSQTDWKTAEGLYIKPNK